MAEEPNEEVFIEDNSITLEDTDNSEIVDEKRDGYVLIETIEVYTEVMYSLQKLKNQEYL